MVGGNPLACRYIIQFGYLFSFRFFSPFRLAVVVSPLVMHMIGFARFACLLYLVVYNYNNTTFLGIRICRSARGQDQTRRVGGRGVQSLQSIPQETPRIWEC